MDAAVHITSQAVQPIVDSLVQADGVGDVQDVARRAALAGARAAFLAARGVLPETAARLALRRMFPEVGEREWIGELEEEIYRRGMTVKLSWSRAPMTHADILAKRKALRGGIYIRVNAMGRPIKVGKTIDFHDRTKSYPATARFWIASITTSEKDPTGIVEAVEHAVARTLMRLGYSLPYHHQPRSALETSRGYKIIIRNLLPAPYVRSVSSAYGRPVATSHTPPGKARRPDETGKSHPAPPESGALILTPSMSWETTI
jgi:hypothetical protein